MKGTCFCGAVEFEVSGTPAFVGYCHCGDCAAWAGAPITAFALFPTGSVSVGKGAEKVGTYNKTENAYRKFCTTCGGHLFVDIPQAGMVDVFHTTVPEMRHEPTMHVYYANKSVAVKDGLPKFKDMPAEAGGSGETMPE